MIFQLAHDGSERKHHSINGALSGHHDADQRTDLAELHGNDPVDLQTQGQRQRRTGCLLETTGDKG